MDTTETIVFEIALTVTITVLTEISQFKDEDAARVFLYLAYTLLKPNFNNFHVIVCSSEVAVMAASGRKRILWLECTRVIG